MSDFSCPPLSFILLFEAGWHDFEEYGCIYIYIRDGKYFSLHDSHCVMDISRPREATWDDIQEITEDEVYEIMEEWKDLECL